LFFHNFDCVVVVKIILYAIVVECATYLGQGWLRGPGTGGQIASGVVFELLIF
jgi:hypothetical protein